MIVHKCMYISEKDFHIWKQKHIKEENRDDNEDSLYYKGTSFHESTVLHQIVRIWNYGC